MSTTASVTAWLGGGIKKTMSELPYIASKSCNEGAAWSSWFVYCCALVLLIDGVDKSKHSTLVGDTLRV